MEGLLVLPQDINITPVKELPANVREQIQAEEGDYAITRPRSRTPSKIVDPQTMALLTEFDRPKTIVDAVLDISKTLGIPASRLLEDAFPVLQAFYAQKLLVDAGSQQEGRIEPTLAAGDRIANATISRNVQVVEDTEIYIAVLDDGTDAALKISRGPGGNMIERESGVLSELNGAAGPNLLSTGKTEDGRTYLLMEWIDGADAIAAVKTVREEHGQQALPYILAICAGILDAYADLHSRGVVHCDVHARNLLISRDGRVRLLDFGMARMPDHPVLSKAPAGGVPAFYTPEFARTILDNTAPPDGSFASEQYSVAALLYWIIAGNHYLDFSMVREELARQILKQEPIPLKDRGVEGLDRLDAVLRKALCKNPELRFRNMAEFAAEFRAALRRREAPPSAPAVNSINYESFVDKVLSDLQDPCRDVPARGMVAPSMSVTYGKAGIAHAIHRIAAARNDSKLLSLADLWAGEAAAGAASADAFYSESIHITPEIVGRVSPYHTAGGIYAVQALIANSMGDGASLQRAIEQFMAAAGGPCDNVDLTLGANSVVIALTLLLDAISTSGAGRPAALLDRGNELTAEVWDKLDSHPPIREGGKQEYLGIAHGWGGFCYAALRWALASGSPLPAALETRLDQLLACAELTGSGVRWPWGATKGGRQMLPGWCNGVAGHVFLWTLAHRMLGKQIYLDMAERSARETANFEAGLHTLCCGSAGQAYALLSLYKHTRDPHWLHGAQAQAAQAVRSAQAIGKQTGPDIPFSLYKGSVGVAVLLAELEKPEFSSMPFFEEEAWR